MKQRWYDKDPTVSLAVSLLKNSSTKQKILAANGIIKIAKENRVEIPSGFFSKLNKTFKRWYDEDKILSEAMEYLLHSSAELRKEISIDVIQLLESAEYI